MCLIYFRPKFSKSHKMSVMATINKVFTAGADWSEKEELLDVIYWSRQIIGLVLGAVWGLVPLHGFLGLALFGALSAGLVYVWFTAVQGIDEAEYGGVWELTKEGFLSGAAGFLVTWIIVYTGLHVDKL